MPLITSAIPNLIGGVSQQPPAIRNPNEAEVLDNAIPSPVEGLIKRPPTEHIAVVSASNGTPRQITVSQPPFIHLLERDESEKYIMCVQEDGTLDVYNLAGTRQTIYIHDNASLGAATKFQRKALTIGDVTFLANTTTTIAATNDLTSQTPTNYNRAGLLWIRQANYYREHTIELTSASVTSTFSHISRSIDISNAGSSGTNGVYTNVQLTYVSGTEAQTYPTATITVSNNKVSKVQILTDGVGWETENIEVTLSVSTTPTNPIGGVNNFQVVYKSLGSGEIGTDHISKSLFSGNSGGYIGPAGGIDNHATYGNSTQKDSVIYLQGSADFTVVLKDDFGGLGVTFIRDKVERFDDLPPTAPHGYMVKVEGTPESPFDDYWVKFVAEDGNFSRGLWKETTAPGIAYKFDTSTLPLILIRQSNGTFMLKKANGTTPTTVQGLPAGSSATLYNDYDWSQRLVGDNKTNPLPSFVGEKINDMVFYQNRLGFMAGENIIFSETSEFFNFWRTTTLDLLDTDPIDIASSSPRVGKIFSAVPFNRDLILFTPTSQFVLRGGDILSPKSVAMIPAADFENQADKIEPIASANSIFFTYANGNYVGMRELVPQPAIDGAYLANDLSNNVSKYIPGPASHMTATTHDNIAVVVSQGNLYCYRYFMQNNERLQSAWFRFTFNDSGPYSNSFAKCVWAGFLDSDLYVAMLRTRNDSTLATSWLTIEKIRMGAGLTDAATSGKNWLTYLDQRKYYAAGEGTYNANTGLTTFTLVKPLSYRPNQTTVVTTDGYQALVSSGTNFTGTSEATISVVGNYSAKAVWIGTPYTMAFELSTPYIRGSAGRGVAAFLNGRYQLRYLTVQYADSAYFRVQVGIKNENTYEYSFTGEIVGSANIGSTNVSSGNFRVPVYSKNDNTVIKILNDSPLPSKLLSCEFEAFYNDRATRFNG